MSHLTTRLGDFTMPTPVMTASGCGGPDLAAYVDLAEVGALVTRTVTVDPQAGAPMPRLIETPGGVLACSGDQNAGLDGFLATELPWYARQRLRVVVSISGDTLGECGELARRVGGSPGVGAVELRLGAMDPFQTGKAVHVVRRDLPHGLALLAKLAPGAGAVDVGAAAVENGADAVVVGGGHPGLAIDPDTLRPALGAGTGLLSGPAVHTLALRSVWDLHEAFPDLPIVGGGGVRTGADALALLAAGATAVQLGSVLLHDPSAPARVTAELASELDGRGFASATDAVGVAHQPQHQPDAQLSGGPHVIR